MDRPWYKKGQVQSAVVAGVFVLLATVAGLFYRESAAPLFPVAQEKADAQPPKSIQEIKGHQATGRIGLAMADKRYSPVTFEQFAEHYRTDLQATHSLRGRLVVWEGQVSVVREEDNAIHVTILNKDGVGKAHCHFDKADLQDLLALAVGQRIQFIGIVEDVSVGEPTLEQCKLVALLD